jgi:YD repeat-containing protein
LSTCSAAAGPIASRTYPDGTSTAYTYNDDGSLATATSAGPPDDCDLETGDMAVHGH